MRNCIKILSIISRIKVACIEKLAYDSYSYTNIEHNAFINDIVQISNKWQMIYCMLEGHYYEKI